MTDGRTAILHLGTYKTGSSAIQNFLYANRALLAERGLLYPRPASSRATRSAIATAAWSRRS